MKSKPILRGCIMRTLIKLRFTLGAILALMAVTFVVAGCRGGDSFWWDPWAGDKYLADAGDITTDPDPVVANQLAHITITFNVTSYSELISKDSVLDPGTRTLTVTAYVRERDGRLGSWDGTIAIATTFPESGIWHIVIPQAGGRVVGADLYVQPEEGAWADGEYIPDASDVITAPDPMTASQLAHITINFNAGTNAELISQDSILDPVGKTLTVTVHARDRANQSGGWDGTVVVPVTFPSSGFWHLIILQEDGGAATVDLYVQPPEGAPVEDVWAGDVYFPDAGDITTDPDPLVVNNFSHITISFLTTDGTELISQESSLDPDTRNLTVTVVARERLNQPGAWDGKVTVPVTFLDAGIWHLVIPQEDDRESAVDLYVQPEEGAPEPILWAGDPYLPDAADVTTSPDPLQVNKLAHITISFNSTAFTDLISQESALDQAARTLTVTVYARERDNQAGGWDGTVVIPVTFLERGVWQLIIPQAGDREVSVDLYVYPEEDAWAGSSYFPNAGDITADPDPVIVNQLTHITVNFNITDYTELTAQQWVLDPVGMTLTITVYARERADKSGSWDGTVTVPVTFLNAGAWQIVVRQMDVDAVVDLYVQAMP